MPRPLQVSDQLTCSDFSHFCTQSAVIWFTAETFFAVRNLIPPGDSKPSITLRRDLCNLVRRNAVRLEYAEVLAGQFRQVLVFDNNCLPASERPMTHKLATLWYGWLRGDGGHPPNPQQFFPSLERVGFVRDANLPLNGNLHRFIVPDDITFQSFCRGILFTGTSVHASFHIIFRFLRSAPPCQRGL